MKTFKILIIILLFSTLTHAQPWSVNSVDYEFSMNITGRVKIDDNFINHIDSYMGAFVDDDCRGVVQATEVNAGEMYFFLTIYSNSSSGEDITFKFQDDNEVVTDFTVAVSFVSDGIYGNPDNPFIWIYPNNTDVTDFLFFSGDAQIGETSIDLDLKKINLEVGSSVNLNRLVTFFSVPAGTEVFVGTELQQSGASQNDFANPVIYTLKNGKTEQDWTVSISQSASVNDFSKQFHIYPNPTKGNFIINFEGEIISEITVSDLTGKIILKTIPKRSNDVELDISNKENGIYFVNVKTVNGNYIKKIIKK